MYFLASIDCTCSRFRSRDPHHVLIQVPMRASFQLFFPACVNFHSLKPSLWLQDWGLPCWLLFLLFPASAIISTFQLQL